jgi:hypothetical protein
MTLFANGIDLSTLCYNVSSLTGRWTGPPRRGKDVDVPGRHGTVRSPRKKFTSGTVVLPMWVLGCDENGEVPSDARSQEVLYHNIDRLTRLFASDTVELVHYLPTGSVRRITGQVMDAIDLTSQAGGTRAEFAVSLVTASAFWEDVAAVAATRTGTGLWDVVPFSGATAPMDNLVVKFTGPATNPRLTNPSGVYLAYNAVLTGSQSVSIDCNTWLPTGTGITASVASVDHGGDPKWFVLEPGDPTPRVTASQTAGSTGVFTLSGRRKYLVG